MGKFVDISGKRFGRLVVMNVKEKTKSGGYLWNCQCDCGNIIKSCFWNLKKGKTKSCGCFKRDNIVNFNFKHGNCYTRIYRIWAGMKDRCNNPKNDNYHNYGGRGITICENWENHFDNFYNWSISNGYEDNLSIERIDVNGNYCPQNCKWATIKEQNNNTRRSILITYNGETKTLKEWSCCLNLSYGTIYSRYKNGYTVEEIFNIPVRPKKLFIEYENKVYPFVELAKTYKIDISTLRNRLKKGWSLIDALNIPSKKKKGNRNGQIDFGGHTVEAFLENLPETT
jgi:hypothetical protein